MALGADAAGEEQAEVRPGLFVRARVAAVLADVAAGGRVRFREVFVFPVTAGPLVVPYVEDGACLEGELGFEGGGVDLGAGGAAFSTDHFGFLLRGGGGVDEGGFAGCDGR